MHHREIPSLAILWLGEPDSTQHTLPLGSPDHLAVLKQADQNAKLVMDAVASLNDRDEVLFLIGSDHGHQTVSRVVHIEEELVKASLKTSLESDDVVVASNGTSALVYLHSDAAARESQLEDFFKAQAWAGIVLHADELSSVGQSRDHGLTFAVSMRASSEPNSYGVPGTSVAAKRTEGKDDTIGSGQHGGLGDAEQSPFLMIAGAGFEVNGVRHDAASVVDIAPTILTHLGLPASGMDGRALQSSRAGNGHG